MPVNSECLGEDAKKREPLIKQVILVVSSSLAFRLIFQRFDFFEFLILRFFLWIIT